MSKVILNFFDRLENRSRRWLSRYPIIYAIVSGIAVVLFWRGVWETADLFGLPAPLSMIIGMLLLLVCGVFVSHFIGNQIIISGLRGEKKLEEKTIEEIMDEETILHAMYRKLEKMEKDLTELKGK